MVSAARHRGIVSRRIVIAAPGRIAVPNFEHMWEAREVLFRFGLRDITLRYRQTALGVVWVVLQPLPTVLDYLKDYVHTEEGERATRTCLRIARAAGVGSTWHNVS